MAEHQASAGRLAEVVRHWRSRSTLPAYFVPIDSMICKQTAFGYVQVDKEHSALSNRTYAAFHLLSV